MDLDLPRPRGFAPQHPDLHDTVDILRLDPLMVDFLGKADHPPELAREAFLPIELRLLVGLQLALARHGEQILLYRDIEALGIDSGGEKIDIHPLGRLADIDGGEATPGQRPDA